MSIRPNARVGVIGAGPGDPGLITVRGRELLEKADVAILDDFLADAFVHMLPKDCEKYLVGRKVRGFSMLKPEEACEVLVDRALRGKSVVRLKTGDPFLFGAGCEELIACRSANVPVEIVPGVSRLFAGPALAGIPLLLRGVSGSVLVLPGNIRGEVPKPAVVEVPHMLDKEPDRQVGIVIRRRKAEADSSRDSGIVEKPRVQITEGKGVDAVGDSTWGFNEERSELESPMATPRQLPGPEDSGIVGGARVPEDAALTREDFKVDWAVVCRSAETLVFETVERLGLIREGLLTGGRSATEPVAMIRGRGTVSEIPLISTVDKMEEDANAARIKMPVTLVVGDVVTLREHIAHFTDRPLQGLRIAVTQPDEPEDRDLDEQLRLHGARPIYLPLVQHTPLVAIEEIVAALRDDLRRADVLVVDSPRAARLLAVSLERSWLDWRVLSPSAQVVGVGSATARVLEKHGLRADAIERGELNADAILALLGRDPAGLHVLMAGIDGSLRTVGEELIARGGGVLDVPLAESQKLLANALTLKNALHRQQIHAVLFITPEDVRVCLDSWGVEATRQLLREVAVYAWDPPTAHELRSAGIAPDGTSPRADAAALLPIMCERADRIRA